LCFFGTGGGVGVTWAWPEGLCCCNGRGDSLFGRLGAGGDWLGVCLFIKGLVGFSGVLWCGGSGVFCFGGVAVGFRVLFGLRRIGWLAGGRVGCGSASFRFIYGFLGGGPGAGGGSTGEGGGPGSLLLRGLDRVGVHLPDGPKKSGALKKRPLVPFVRLARKKLGKSMERKKFWGNKSRRKKGSTHAEFVHTPS